MFTYAIYLYLSLSPSLSLYLSIYIYIYIHISRPLLVGRKQVSAAVAASRESEVHK